MEEALIKRLVTSLECGVCKQRYQEDNISVLGHHGELWFMRVYCPGCHTRCIIIAIVQQDSEPEVITDLTEAELAQFSNVDGITGDDLLEMRHFLQEFDGDFVRLFSRK